MCVCVLTVAAQEGNNDNNAEPTDTPKSGTASSPVHVVAGERDLPNITEKKAALLSEELADDAIQWQENQYGRFPIIWEPEGSGNPFGALLFLHGAGQTLDWPHTIHLLRKNLVKFGWSTLAISMPDIDPISIPKRPINDEKENTEPVSEANKISKETISKETISNSRIKAAIDFLQKKGQFNIVVIAYGVSAARAAIFMGDIPQKKTTAAMKPNAKAVIDRPIRALIMVAASNHSPLNKTLLTDYLNDPGLPVLDIYFGNHYLDKTAALARQEGARRQQMLNYEQSQMLEPSIDISNSNRLARRVRGFLNKYAKGVEINK